MEALVSSGVSMQRAGAVIEPLVKCEVCGMVKMLRGPCDTCELFRNRESSN